MYLCVAKCTAAVIISIAVVLRMRNNISWHMVISLAKNCSIDMLWHSQAKNADA